MNSELGETMLLLCHTANGQEAELDHSTLPAGTYFIKLSKCNETYTRKLIR